MTNFVSYFVDKFVFTTPLTELNYKHLNSQKTCVNVIANNITEQQLRKARAKSGEIGRNMSLLLQSEAELLCSGLGRLSLSKILEIPKDIIFLIINSMGIHGVLLNDAWNKKHLDQLSMPNNNQNRIRIGYESGQIQHAFGAKSIFINPCV